MDENIPQQIGRYTVDRLLGAGAMGFVYLGRDPELDRPVAIKTVRHLDLEDDALALFLERFRNEARAAARLHHPNIVQVYDVGEEESIGPYLVFEYVAGSTLKQVLRNKGALAPLAVVRLAEEVGDALQVAHEAGIIHRDIKPDNLLITPNGQAKLADFGVARIPNATLTREGQFLGTPCYAAPETLAEGAYAIRTDLFSFAAVLYEAASGKRAFPGDDALSVAHKVIHDEPAMPRQVADDPSKIPTSVEQVLMDGLSKDPTRRMETASELASALREAYVESGLVSEDSLGRPPSRRISLPNEDTSGGASRYGFIVVLLLVAAIGAALVYLFADDPNIEPVIGTVDDAGVDAGVDAGQDVAMDVAVDVARDITSDEGAPDTSADIEDTEDASDDADAAPAMTPHEREEAAKDALDRARASFMDGDLEMAREALEEAERYDPGNPDIDELRTRINDENEAD